MDIKTKETYSEVYSILNMLGENYITKIPSKLYQMIKEEKSNEYNPQYDFTIALEQQNIKKEALSMIALFHLNYWCNSEAEKWELRDLLKENEIKYQSELREKYNPDNIFKNRKKEGTISENNISERSIIEYTEKNFFQKIFEKIKHLFKRKY